MSVEVLDDGKVWIVSTSPKTPRQARELAVEILLAVKEAEFSSQKV